MINILKITTSARGGTLLFVHSLYNPLVFIQHEGGCFVAWSQHNNICQISYEAGLDKLGYGTYHGLYAVLPGFCGNPWR